MHLWGSADGIWNFHSSLLLNTLAVWSQISDITGFPYESNRDSTAILMQFPSLIWVWNAGTSSLLYVIHCGLKLEHQNMSCIVSNWFRKNLMMLMPVMDDMLRRSEGFHDPWEALGWWGASSWIYPPTVSFGYCLGPMGINKEQYSWQSLSLLPCSILPLNIKKN